MFSSCSFEELPAEHPTVRQIFELPPVTQGTQASDAITLPVSGPLPRSKADVLQMYKEAADLVKLRCPGFVCTIENHAANFRSAARENGLFDAVQSILMENDQSADTVTTVQKGDDLACRTYFPVFHTDYGCLLSDHSIVKGATCYADGSSYNILILFEEQIDPDPVNSAFAQIMTPFTDSALLQSLNAYLPALNSSNTQATLRYYNCEIRCTLDSETGEMVSLSHKMIADVELQVAVDMVFTDLDGQLTCTLIHHADYTSFDW